MGIVPHSNCDDSQASLGRQTCGRLLFESHLLRDSSPLSKKGLTKIAEKISYTLGEWNSSVDLRPYYTPKIKRGKVRILVINPGSTSTKVALYEDLEESFVEDIFHPAEEIKKFHRIIDQCGFRKDVILRVLAEKKVDHKMLDAVVGRGGLKPLPGGTYRVTSQMLDDLKSEIQGEHASNFRGDTCRRDRLSAGDTCIHRRPRRGG